MSHRAAALACLVSVLLTLGAPGSARAAAPKQALRDTLPNGLRVVIVPDRLAPVVTTELAYGVGSNDAPAGFPGMAHALEHMMFRGSVGLDKDQLFELGARLGGIYNASTTETVTQYTYTVPAKDLPLVLQVEALRMNGALLTQADWEQERGAIEQEVSRDLSSPMYTVFAELQATLFAGSVYEHDALGTRESFDRTDAAMLRAFYERWYAPGNAVLVVAGDVDPVQAMAQVRSAFGGIPGRAVPAHAAVVLGALQPTTLRLPTDLSVGLAALAWRMPGRNSVDYAAADILSDVIGSRRGALYALVPAGRALQAEFGYSAKADVGMALATVAYPAGSDPGPALEDMRRILAEAAAGALPPELIEAARRQNLAQLAFAADSISGLARSWARAVAVRPDGSPEDLARAYREVSEADVRRLAREWLNPAEAVTVILSPRGAGAAVAQAGFGGAETVGSVPERPVTLPDWAAAALADAGQPERGPAPDVSVLPNGLRLIVQTEHVTPTVSVFGTIRREDALQEKPGKEGVADLTNELFSFGTERLDRLGLRRAIDDLGASLSAGSSFRLRVLAPQAAEGIALLAETELHPALPDAVLPVLQRQAVQSLTGALTTPGHRFGRAVLEATVPSQDPALRQATPESVASITADDIRAYHDAAFRPELTTIVVIGDITAEEARRLIGQSFGGWAAKGPAGSVDLPPIGASVGSRQRVPDPGSLQDRVALTQTLTLDVTNPDRYALTLGNTILGTGFSSRLYRDLRTRTGYVYSVGSTLDFSRTRARYTVSFGADPANVEAARGLVVRDIEDMQREAVTPAELERARSLVLRRLAMQRADVGGIAALYLRAADLGLPLDSDRVAAEAYSGLTAEAVRRAFATWLRPGALAEVVRGPPS